MSIQNLLTEEIKSELQELNRITLGTDEYKTTVDGITKLVDRAIEFEKLDIQSEDKDQEKVLKTAQMVEDRKARLSRDIIATAGIVIPSVLTVWGTLKSLKFEETGTVTTIMGRGFINRFIPKK